MGSPLDDIAATIGTAFRDIFHAATLTRNVAGTIVDPADPPAPTTVNYSCRALVAEFSKTLSGGNRLQQISQGFADTDEHNLLITATSLSVEPIIDDVITFNAGPFSGDSFTLIAPIKIDPARAVWDCKGKS